MFQVNPLLKIRLDVSSESSARQRIHLKHQALFSLKDKSKQLKCRLLQFLFCALRVIAELFRTRKVGYNSRKCLLISHPKPML